MSARTLLCRSASADETRALAASISASLRPGDVVVLAGDLGAGKTCFVQGAAEALGVRARVTSPSFVLVREYTGASFGIVHADVYRLNSLQELVDLGYEDVLDPSRVAFIEWGDAVSALLPDERLEVTITDAGDDDARSIALCARGASWDERLHDLSARLGARAEAVH